jgi:hypothetical protein
MLFLCRSSLKPVAPGEEPQLLMQNVYCDCGQLDLALALRDHRACVDERLQSRDFRWFPQVFSALGNQVSDMYIASDTQVGSERGSCDGLGQAPADSSQMETHPGHVSAGRMNRSNDKLSGSGVAFNSAADRTVTSANTAESPCLKSKRFGEYSLYDDGPAVQTSNSHAGCTAEPPTLKRFGEYSVYDQTATETDEQNVTMRVVESGCGVKQDGERVGEGAALMACQDSNGGKWETEVSFYLYTCVCS